MELVKYISHVLFTFFNYFLPFIYLELFLYSKKLWLSYFFAYLPYVK